MQGAQTLKNHLETVLGGPLKLAPTKRPGLPVYLARGYTLWSSAILGRKVLFASAKGDREEFTAKQIEADAGALQAAAKGELVVIVLPHIVAHVRRRLIEHRIPFVVPGKQLFLPALGVDLLESELVRPRELPDQLAWVGQVVVLRHLLWRDVEGKSLRAIANTVGYSAMALSNAQRHLVALSLAEVVQKGRARTLRFLAPPRETWKAALPHLRNPVRRTDAVQLLGQLPDALHAGLTALSHLTEIADSTIPTVAMTYEAATDAQEHALMQTCPNTDEADRIVEVWNYDPRVLARGECVDPLSLHLSFRDDPDARTQQAVEHLVERVSW